MSFFTTAVADANSKKPFDFGSGQRTRLGIITSKESIKGRIVTVGTEEEI